MDSRQGILDQWGPAWSSGDPGRILPLFTEDVHFEDVPLGVLTKGHAELRGFVTGMLGALADVRFEVTSRFVSDDGTSGALEWIFHGRQTKDVPGLPATNQQFHVRGSSVVQFRDGKIARESDYWDLTTYMKQVGLSK
jgi:steroid delta-isomerase-like uncharacterized protein